MAIREAENGTQHVTVIGAVHRRGPTPEGLLKSDEER